MVQPECWTDLFMTCRSLLWRMRTATLWGRRWKTRTRWPDTKPCMRLWSTSVTLTMKTQRIKCWASSIYRSAILCQDLKFKTWMLLCLFSLRTEDQCCLRSCRYYAVNDKTRFAFSMAANLVSCCMRRSLIKLAIFSFALESVFQCILAVQRWEAGWQMLTK